MADIRWGIMGTGGIAAAMAGALGEAGSTLVAVGSSRPDAAGEFAREWDIPHAVASHRAVAAHPDVDVVYVATTNDLHRQNVLDCVEAGKPALCEKPLALNARQADEMLGAARREGVLVIEAMWMRFLPFLATVDELIADGAIGKIQSVAASFFHAPPTDTSRRWVNRELGGGSLLDLGIYPLSLIHHLLGPPLDFEATADLGPTGVDLSTTVLSRHEGGTAGTMASSFVQQMDNTAVVEGSRGVIRIHAPFHHSPLVTVEHHDEVVASYDTSYEGHGFRFEIAETERCVAESRIESTVRPHADTIAVMRWMDAIRSECGVTFGADAS